MTEEGEKTWFKVGLTTDFSEDLPLRILVGDGAVAVYRVDNDFYAVDDVCTHEFAYLSDGYVEGCIVECPLHQARFNVKDGKALSPPATEDLKTHPVKLEGDAIFVGFDLPPQELREICVINTSDA